MPTGGGPSAARYNEVLEAARSLVPAAGAGASASRTPGGVSLAAGGPDTEVGRLVAHLGGGSYSWRPCRFDGSSWAPDASAPLRTVDVVSGDTDLAGKNVFIRSDGGSRYASFDRRGRRPQTPGECEAGLGTLRVLSRVVIAGCPNPEGTVAANVEVTLAQGPRTMVRVTGGVGNYAVFEGEDLDADGFEPGPATLSACVRTPQGDCCLAEPVAVELLCIDGFPTLPPLYCDFGYGFWVSIEGCSCDGDTFTIDIQSSDGQSATVTATRNPPEAGGFIYDPPRPLCWPNITPAGQDITVTATITSSSRPAVYDLSGASRSYTHPSSSWPSIGATIEPVPFGLKPDYACCGERPVPRRLLLEDEFGPVELEFAEVLYCERGDGFPAGFATCGYYAKRLGPSDPDALEYFGGACANGNWGYARVNKPVNIFYLLVPAGRCVGESAHPPPGTWRLRRGVIMSYSPLWLYCPGPIDYSRRPVAPSRDIPFDPDHPGDWTTHIRTSGDSFDGSHLPSLNAGPMGHGNAEFPLCGDSPIVAEFSISGLNDSPDPTGSWPVVGIQKYTNGTGIIVTNV